MVTKQSYVQKQKFDPDARTSNSTLFADIARPINWRTDAYNLGTSNDDLYYRSASGSSGVGFKNEDFIVWMRTAAFPTFRKLYRKGLWFEIYFYVTFYTVSSTQKKYKTQIMMVPMYPKGIKHSLFITIIQ